MVRISITSTYKLEMLKKCIIYFGKAMIQDSRVLPSRKRESLIDTLAKITEFTLVSIKSTN